MRLSIVAATITIIGCMRKTRRENDSDTKTLAAAVNDALGKRLDGRRHHIASQITRLEVGLDEWLAVFGQYRRPFSMKCGVR